MRISILPTFFGSWPKVARELDALDWTAIPVSFMGEIPWPTGSSSPTVLK
jgi:hypothetical protein